MNRLVSLAAVSFGILGTLVPSLAGAEIYGWVDPSGDVTYSNLPPPKNARVIEVIPEEPPLPAAAVAQAKASADAAHQSQLQALNDRIRQLEREIQQVQRQPPPMPYPVASAPTGSGCDSELYDCDTWAGPVYYTIGTLEPWRIPHQNGHLHGFRHDGPHHVPHPGGGSGHRSGTVFHR
jgi:hypothetical protein